jgi:hypothetical protein
MVFLGRLDEVNESADPRVRQFFRREPDEAIGAIEA